jgi:hypothetical protein
VNHLTDGTVEGEGLCDLAEMAIIISDTRIKLFFILNINVNRTFKISAK